MKKSRWILLTFVLTALLSGCNLPGLSAQTSPVAPTGSTEQKEATPEVRPTDAPTTQEMPPEPTAPAQTAAAPESGSTAGWVAYVGQDGNVYLTARDGGETLQVTEDADASDDTAPSVRYCCMQWSSDGSLLTYRREHSQEIDNAYQYYYVYLFLDVNTRSVVLTLENLSFLGYDWEPGTHRITYGLPVEQEYWIGRDEVRSELAHGIYLLDVDSHENTELVAPERGYHLSMPRWSPDGRFLSFNEIEHMEGRGMLAFYDMAAGSYNALDEVLGAYSWSADGEWLAYDEIGYRPAGGERIWLRSRSGDERRAISPAYDPPAYAYAPAISPDGEKIAFLVNFGDLENYVFSLMVMDLDGGEPREQSARELGSFEQVWELHWTSDSQALV